ncbi:PKD domain-containing protein [Nocardioides sp. AX2bis]|uniref:PKD domain-containing protein n=1 Tax=Nocardioides sp. AX2bis TaxID=2653157 RepID=UPI0012F4213C|nr:hypothetical protein [Nocardioides sp. AX2bis]VXB16224.1 Glycoprotein gp2 [Nocardioides sp. AX2bis]
MAPPMAPRAGTLTRTRRRVTTVVVAGLVVASLSVGAQGAPVAPTEPDGTLKARTGRLVEAGPTAEHGFPAWYRDSNGVRLEACTTLDDPLCSTLPDEVPDPGSPVSFPDNFPGEFFYQLAGAEVTGNGVDMSIGMDLEGAWAAEEVVDGDQMVFGRIRIRDRGLTDGEYRVTHPYGVDVFEVAGDGINYTQDIGTTPGAFGQALSSRVGPFLVWDPAVAPAAPAGYVGDPGVPHSVVGSPYGTNFVSVERRDDTGGWTELARTDQLSVQGRHATNSGVDVRAATYSVGADGRGFVDVYATSDAGQSIRVRDAGLGFVETGMEGDRGAYYGRFAVDREPDGRSLTVVNAGDRPVAQKQAVLTDVVTVHRATYDADTDLLTVSASSSDQDSTPGRLRVLGEPLVDGRVVISTVAPTATVTVTSDKGGTTTVPVDTTGAGMQAEKPVAAAFANPADAAPGQRVTLTGTGSTGTIGTYAWRQVPGTVTEDVEVTLPDGSTGTQPSTVEVPVTDLNRVSLAGADSAVATFEAPAGATGPLAFELVVSGPAGTSEPVVVAVNVVAPSPTDPLPAPTADAGPDQAVRRASTVQLDGTRSALVDEMVWTRLSGPAVTLTGATTPRASFVMPSMPLPTSTTGTNPGYAPTDEPVVLRLTVTGQRGQQSTDEVTVVPAPDTLAVTAAEFRAGKEWRVAGTSSVLAGQRVAVVLGSTLTGRVLGFATVDATGAWVFRGAGAVVPPAATTTVSAVSALGGRVTGAAFRRR